MGNGAWNLLRSLGIGRPAFFRARRFDSDMNFRFFFFFFFFPSLSFSFQGLYIYPRSTPPPSRLIVKAKKARSTECLCQSWKIVLAAKTVPADWLPRAALVLDVFTPGLC